MQANPMFGFKLLHHEAMNVRSFPHLTSLLAILQMPDNALQVHELDVQTNSQGLRATGM